MSLAEKEALQSPAEAHRPVAHAQNLAPPSQRKLSKSRPREVSSESVRSDSHADAQRSERVAESSLPYVDESARNPNETIRSDHPPQSGGTGNHTISTSSQIPPELLARRPPQHPALLPEYRYCYKDGFVKPMRAHHCRICGTVSPACCATEIIR